MKRTLAVSARFLVLFVPLLTAQTHLPDPVRFWSQKSAYAGSEACGVCHAEIYALQRTSHHARSLRPAHEAPQLSAGLPFVSEDRAAESTLTLERIDSDQIQLRSSKGSEQSVAILEWAFGSGLKGITPVGRTADGALVESRLTWYKRLRGFGFTTGATQYNPSNARESLGRELSSELIAGCFGCHTTGYDPQRQAPARDEMGVRCERCHGPGLEHIKASASGQAAREAIFNPARLEGFAQVQMTGSLPWRASARQ